MKKSLLLLAASLLTAFTASAWDDDTCFESPNEQGVTIYYEIIHKTKQWVCVTGKFEKGNNYSGTVEIPKNVLRSGINYSVVRVDASAFANCDQLVEVTLPSSVFQIEGQAFVGCPNLTTVTTGGVEDLAAGTFSGCTGLTTVSLNKTLKSIGHEAFMGCTSLKSLTLPENLRTIEGFAFSGCTSLESITIPESVIEIGDGAFRGCTALTGFYGKFASDDNKYLNADGKLVAVVTSGLTTFKVPTTVTEIGDYAFENCTGLTSVTISKNVTRIGEFAFSECSKLAAVTIPTAVTEIGVGAFNNCKKITKIGIPEGIPAIPDMLCNGCSALSSVSIPSSVTEIGSKAFSGTNLSAIAIPESVVVVGLSAFYGTPLSDSKNYTEGVLYIGNYLIDADKTKVSGKYEVKAGTIAIGSSAFTDCKSLTEVVLPSSLKTIGERAFWGCTGLTSIFISETVNLIKSEAFTLCSALTSITVDNDYPENIKVEGDLTGIKFADATLYVPKGTRSAYLKKKPWSLFKTIEEMDKNYDYSFTKDGIYYEITGYGAVRVTYRTEYYNTYSGNVEIPETVEDAGNATYTVIGIGPKAFYGCKDLTSVSIPNTVTSIGDSAFSECGKLTTVSMPESLESIGTSAFEGCSAMETVIVPMNVVNIGGKAFSKCYAIKSVTELSSYPAGITLGDDVFSATPITSATLYVPKGSKTAYSGISPWNTFKSIEESAYTVAAANSDGVLIYYNLNSDGTTMSVTNAGTYNTYSGNIVIPQTVKYGSKSYKVTAVGSSAFESCVNLISVTIPNTVTSIDSYAFMGCTKLATVNFSSKLTSIGDWAFWNCDALTTVDLPEGLTTIGKASFYYCASLATVNIPASVSNIGQGAFSGCKKLVKVYANNTNPANITMGTIVFQDSSAKDARLYVPAGKAAAYGAADQWKDFGIILEMGTQYDFYAENAEGYGFYYDINDDNKSVTVTYREMNNNSETYKGEPVLTNKVSYGDRDFTVTAIGYLAFNCCKDLETVTLAEAVTLIDMQAFAGSNIVKMTIPATVTTIGECAFQECDKLEQFTVLNEDPANITLGDDVFFMDELENVTLYVPKGCKELYEVAPQWEDFAPNIVELGGTGVEDVVVDPTRPADDVYYDLQGRRVLRPARGLYILNGRKVVVK